MKKRLSTIAIILVLLMVTQTFALAAVTDDYNIVEEPAEVGQYTAPEVIQFQPGMGSDDFREGEGSEMYLRLRAFAYANGALSVGWDGETRSAIIMRRDGISIIIPIEEVGGFIENGVSWVPQEFVWEVLWTLLNMALHEPFVDRIDLNLWNFENFADIREASFSTDLEHGVIAVNFIEYMSENLGARSAFSYAELDAAIWIVEELLAMGHEWENIYVQEFTYWELRSRELGGLFGGLHWSSVISPMILGVGRHDQTRRDRVSQNVILTIPGQSERKIIVGAHYDSPPYPSASDNASGTALLMESAQRMLELDNYYTLVYVFFGAEEVGLIGAAYFYEELTPAQRNNIVMMVNADVLIEGPYIIYGAGAMPEVTDELIEFIIEAIYEQMLEHWDEQLEWFYEMYETGEWWWDGMSPTEAMEHMIQSQLEWMTEMPQDSLVMQAGLMGILEPEVNAVARKVNEMAAALTARHDFELISIPQSIAGSSDNLIFLSAGHTIVAFWGMERLGNLTEDFQSGHPMAGMPMWGDFVATILHSPSDEFHFIENQWPGMMNRNLKAFSLLLEKILTSQFS